MESICTTAYLRESPHLNEAYCWRENSILDKGDRTPNPAKLEIKSIGTMKPDQTAAMSQDFCQQINQTLGVPKNRIYIEFADAKDAMWGWNGTTFG
jgi:phenylpyruvate tautomerase PptA (4-oxalocrotonate tautomerase family)